MRDRIGEKLKSGFRLSGRRAPAAVCGNGVFKELSESKSVAAQQF
jgi:hypothetical protein